MSASPGSSAYEAAEAPNCPATVAARSADREATAVSWKPSCLVAAAWAVATHPAPCNATRVTSLAGQGGDDRSELVDVFGTDDHIRETPTLATLEQTLDEFVRRADEGEG